MIYQIHTATGLCHQVNLENSSHKSGLPSEIATADAGVLRSRVVQGHKRPLHVGFPERLRRLRKKCGLSQSALAQMIGWGTTAALESGTQRPAIDTVERLAIVLGVSPGWLAYGHEAWQPFRQRQPRLVLPPEPPEPTPTRREPPGYWKAMPSRLKSARAARGMTLGSVARAAGISPQALSLAEAGKMVARVKTCEQLAEALGVAPGWLAYGDESSGEN